MRAACERIRAAVETASGSASTATTTRTASAPLRSPCSSLRELGADVEWHLPSRFEEGYGVSSETIGRLADEGCRLVLTVDCGITAVDEVAEARAARARRDRHRPPPARRHAPRLPDRGHAAVRLPLSGALRHRRRATSSAQALLGSESEAVRRGTSTSSPSRRSPTSCRSSTRTARSPPPACGARRAPRSRGLRALMRTARVDPAAIDACGRRLPARAAHQRRRPPRAPGHRARAPADRGRRRGGAARRAAGGAEPRAAGRRGADRCARRSHESRSGREARAPPPRLRRSPTRTGTRA